MINLKNFLLQIKNNKFIFISILLYILIFIFIYGYRILNPLYTDWLLTLTRSDEGDPYLTHLEFLSYINSNDIIPYSEKFAYPFHLGLIYADIIPMLAIIIKIFIKIFNLSSMVEVQYVGIVGLINAILSGLFFYLILKKLTKASDINIILCSVFFAFSPIFLERFPRNHTLTEQWLILLSFFPFVFYNEMSNKLKLIFSFVLGCLCCGTDIYFVPIVSVNIFAFAAFDYFKQKNLKFSLNYIFQFILSSFLIFCLFGGFPLGDLCPFSILRDSSANLLAFIMPNNTFYPTRAFLLPFLNDLPKYDIQQAEGYAYLGAGVILLIIFILAYLLTKRIKFNFEKLYVFIFLFIFFLSLIFALSPDIKFLNKLLISIPLPYPIEYAWGIFRNTGRFIWNDFSLIYLLVFFIVLKLFKNKICCVILLVCLFLQFLDMSVLIKDLHNDYFHMYKYKADSTIEKLNSIVSKNNIKTFINHNEYLQYYDKFADSNYYALKNNINVNLIITSRRPNNVSEFLYSKYEKPEDSDLFLFHNFVDEISFIKNRTKLKYCYDIGEYIICSKKLLNTNENIQVLL